MLLRTGIPFATCRWRIAAGKSSLPLFRRIGDGRFRNRRCSAQFSTQSKPRTDDGKLEPPGVVKKLADEPYTCTGDELHYINAADGKWKLAMWRYRPVCSAPVRNHPLLLLSGVATNAIGFDLDPSVSFARYMAEHGFDTWILEMRAAGLSTQKEENTEMGATISQQAENLDKLEEVVERLENGEPDGETSVQDSQKDRPESLKENGSSHGSSEESTASNKQDSATSSSWEISKTASQLSSTLSELSERLKVVVNEGQSRVLSVRLAEQVSAALEDSKLSHRYQEIKERLLKLLEERRSLAFSLQLNDLTSRLTKMLEEAQVSVSHVKELQGKLASTIDDFRKFLEFMVNFDWDFDNYVEDDVPAAMNYILDCCKPRDGKLIGVGHSMGGIVLYALLAIKGRDAGFAGVVTIASSLDYSSSHSSLHKLLPLADPAQALNVPVVPVGAIMQAAYPLITKPPYALAWIGNNVSAEGMMDPELYKRLVLNNFCTVPAKLILQLKTAFEPGGLRSRDGKVTYTDLLSKCEVPVLAVAGDLDLVCPPNAVLETFNALPENMRNYVCFGGDKPHRYGHYDLLVARAAKAEVFPVILEFVKKCDQIPEQEN